MVNQYQNSRREFLRKATLGGAVGFGFSHIVSEAWAGSPPKIALAKDDVILFQGDSITDAGRNRDETSANNTRALGSGYAFHASSSLLYDHPDKNLRMYNRGISGNKVYQLAERWDTDCLHLKPSVLSILIGVNDFWHTLNGKYDGTPETYHNDFRELLGRTRQAIPHVKLIIGEPFAVPGVKAVDESWFPRFSEYQNSARQLAEEFKAVFIPYQSIFDTASRSAPGAYWTHDGVHPSIAGGKLMAEAWLKAVGKR